MSDESEVEPRVAEALPSRRWGCSYAGVKYSDINTKAKQLFEQSMRRGKGARILLGLSLAFSSNTIFLNVEGRFIDNAVSESCV